MAGHETFLDKVRDTLSKLYPREEGWIVQENRLALNGSRLDFVVQRRRHVVVVDAKPAPEINLEDVLKIDTARDSVQGILAVIYTLPNTVLPLDVERQAQRLGVRIIRLQA